MLDIFIFTLLFRQSRQTRPKPGFVSLILSAALTVQASQKNGAALAKTRATPMGHVAL